MSPALPIGTLVDDPAGLPEPRPPLMKRMCCVPACQLVLGWVVCRADLAGDISHGYCPDCLEKLLEEIAQLERALGAGGDDFPLGGDSRASAERPLDNPSAARAAVTTRAARGVLFL